MTEDKCLAKPKGLSPRGSMAYVAIMKFLEARDLTNSGGCRVFYSPEEWAERGEDYGRKSLLVVVHDGGDHAQAFNMDYERYELCEAMQKALYAVGCFAEQCTSWYSAIYEVG